MRSESWVFRVEAQESESLGHFLGRFRRVNHLSHKAVAEHLGVRGVGTRLGDAFTPTQPDLAATNRPIQVSRG
jgi:hypothetical protein